MKILALETAVDPGSVALWLEGEIVERFCPEGLSNSATLLPLAAQILADAGLSFACLDGLAFGQGPGAFTGLRVSCGLAQGLAFFRRQGMGGACGEEEGEAEGFIHGGSPCVV